MQQRIVDRFFDHKKRPKSILNNTFWSGFYDERAYNGILPNSTASPSSALTIFYRSRQFPRNLKSNPDLAKLKILSCKRFPIIKRMVALAVQFLVIQYVKSVGRDMSFFGNDLVPIGLDLYLLVFRYSSKNQGNDQNHKKNYTFSHFQRDIRLHPNFWQRQDRQQKSRAMLRMYERSLFVYNRFQIF